MDERECGGLGRLGGELPVDFLVAECGGFGVDRGLGQRDTVFLDRIPFAFQGGGECVYGFFSAAAELCGQVGADLDDVVGLGGQLGGRDAAVFQLGADQRGHLVVGVAGESDGAGRVLGVFVDGLRVLFENVVHGAHGLL